MLHWMPKTQLILRKNSLSCVEEKEGHSLWFYTRPTLVSDAGSPLSRAHSAPESSPDLPLES